MVSARLRQSQSRPHHPTVCRDFIEALDLCHTSNWKRLTGGCNDQKSALIQCLRKEVSVQPPHFQVISTSRRAVSARLAIAPRPRSGGSRPNKCGGNFMKTIKCRTWSLSALPALWRNSLTVSYYLTRSEWNLTLNDVIRQVSPSHPSQDKGPNPTISKTNAYSAHFNTNHLCALPVDQVHDGGYG